MKKLHLVLGALALAAGAACLAIPTAHAAAPAIASVTAEPTALVWQPAGAYQRMELTVSGPGGVFRREFDGATAPTLGLYGADGHPLADGSYSWELRATPVLSEAVRAELARARETGDESRLDALRRSGELPGEPLVVSGHFRVHDGAFMRGDLDEASAPAGDTSGPRAISGEVTSIHAADQVIPDDIIGQASLCVGFDCVNGENFGFDTIRLKENNLRIRFMDTSVGAFPSRDWQLVANDSASGGANRFSIEDIDGARTPFTVTAGAAANSIFVDSTGRVGLRTSTPVLDLHINTSNTPALRLEQNNSGGFTAQTWDVAGNEANFFVRDVTGGSRLSFRIRPGAPTSSIDIANDGDVGIGTASPDAPLEVQRAASGLLMQLEGEGDVFFRQKNATNGQFVDLNLIGNDFRVNFGTGGGGPELILTNNGDLTVTGDVFSATCTAPGNPCAPDFVFEPGYPLMDLDRLGEFIAENRHLPAVPSADQLEQQGRVNLGQFQMTLLQKIEELTLYTLDQHETIAAQQASLAELRAEVAELKKAAKTD